jgi:hypothetical protein
MVISRTGGDGHLYNSREGPFLYCRTSGDGHLLTSVGWSFVEYVELVISRKDKNGYF